MASLYKFKAFSSLDFFNIKSTYHYYFCYLDKFFIKGKLGNIDQFLT